MIFHGGIWANYSDENYNLCICIYAFLLPVNKAIIYFCCNPPYYILSVTISVAMSKYHADFVYKLFNLVVYLFKYLIFSDLGFVIF